MKIFKVTGQKTFTDEVLIYANTEGEADGIARRVLFQDVVEDIKAEFSVDDDPDYDDEDIVDTGDGPIEAYKLRID